MKAILSSDLSEALTWCQSILGPVEVLTEHSKQHGNHESSICRLRSAQGVVYLKVHETAFHWHNEVHAYEQWAPAFGRFAPRLLAAREEAPLALIVSELPGRIVEDALLSLEQQRAVWRSAGEGIRPLHELGAGEYFGACRRDGTPLEPRAESAAEHLTRRYGDMLDQAAAAGYLNAPEINLLQAARELIPAFESERPAPCHRDYCAANWLYHPDGSWAGIIDFEFAAWDVRAADFTRDPQWCWVRRPDLMEAFYEGYGRPFSAQEQQQILFGHAEYALGAIVWGRENAFYGFEREGRESLAHLARTMSV